MLRTSLRTGSPIWIGISVRRQKCSPTNGSGWTPRRTTSSDVRRGSPWCAGAGPRIRLPGHSHRRQGPRHTWWILQSSRGWKTNHRIRGRFLRPTDYGTLHREIDAKMTVKKTVNSEEDRELGRRPWIQSVTDEDWRPRPKFDFSVILSKCLVLRSFLVLEGPA